MGDIKTVNNQRVLTLTGVLVFVVEPSVQMIVASYSLVQLSSPLLIIKTQNEKNQEKEKLKIEPTMNLNP